MSAKPALGLFLVDRKVEISRVSADGSRLERFGSIDIPPNLVVNGEIQAMAQVVSVMKQLMQSASPRAIQPGEEVVIGVPDNRVFLRVFTLPSQAGKEIEEAVEFRIRSLQPLLPIDVETDWKIIGQDSDGQIEILLAAVPKKIISSYHQAAEAVGLVVVAVEPAVFASIRILDPKLLKGKNQLLVHVSNNYAEFTYLTNANPRFSDFLSDADIAKKGSIVNAIIDYISFANSKNPLRAVTEVVVSGSHPQLETIVSSLISRKIPAVLGVSRLATSAVKDHGLLNTAHGLSLRVTDADVGFNLLPMDFRKMVVMRRAVGNWRVVINTLIGLSVVSLVGLGLFYTQLRTRQSTLTGLNSQIQDQLSQSGSKELIDQALSINQLADDLVTFREAVGGEERILQELSTITPTGLTLTSVLLSRDPASERLLDSKSSWMIVGTANSRALVLSFYQQLIAVPEFANGKLFFGSLSKETAITFKIASVIKP